MIERRLIDKYPFLPDSKAIIGEREGLVPDSIEREKAIGRAIDSVKANAQTNDFGNLRTFTLSKLLICLLDNDYYLMKFAQTESSRAASNLREESDWDFLKIVGSMFTSLEKIDEETFAISLIDFLNSSNDMEQYQINKGKIILNREQLIGTFRKATYGKIRNFNRIPQDSQVRVMFKDDIENLLSRLPKPPIISSYSGKYLSLPCVKNALAHTPEGKRYYACLSICIACKKDGLSVENANGILEQFVNNSGKTSHPFTIKEALATLNWVYKKNPNFSCKMQRANGLATPDICKSPCTYESSRIKINRVNKSTDA